MNESVAYLDGQYLPLHRAGLPVWDGGFVLGTTVIEQLRTFGGSLFHVEEHLDRLFRSLDLVGIDADIEQETLADVAQQIVKRNWPLLDPQDDLGVSIFVTPGDSTSLTDGNAGSPRIGVHSFPIAFRLWADKYTTGQKLIITETRHVPNECWSAEIKCRSRMNYHLADQEARRRDPDARALLLDMQGNVTEASTANVAIYREDEGIVTPPRGHVLPGVSLRVLLELSESLGIPTSQRELLPEDVHSADEVLLSSTPFGILPVVQVDGRPIGTGTPGPTFTQILAKFNDLVGVDLAEQARQFACRKNTTS